MSSAVCHTGADLKTCLWDIGAGEVLAELSLNDIVFSLSFNSNGEKLVAACKDKMVRVLEARTLEVIQVCSVLSHPFLLQSPTPSSYRVPPLPPRE